MSHFLERLRQKTDAEKKVFALSISAVVVVVIFISWLSMQSLDTSIETVKEVTTEEVETIKTPLSLIKNTFTALSGVLGAVEGVEQ